MSEVMDKAPVAIQGRPSKLHLDGIDTAFLEGWGERNSAQRSLRPGNHEKPIQGHAIIYRYLEEVDGSWIRMPFPRAMIPPTRRTNVPLVNSRKQVKIFHRRSKGCMAWVFVVDNYCKSAGSELLGTEISTHAWDAPDRIVSRVRLRNDVRSHWPANFRLKSLQRGSWRVDPSAAPLSSGATTILLTPRTYFTNASAAANRFVSRRK